MGACALLCTRIPKGLECIVFGERRLWVDQKPLNLLSVPDRGVKGQTGWIHLKGWDQTKVSGAACAH